MPRVGLLDLSGEIPIENAEIPCRKAKSLSSLSRELHSCDDYWDKMRTLQIKTLKGTLISDSPLKYGVRCVYVLWDSLHWVAIE